MEGNIGNILESITSQLSVAVAYVWGRYTSGFTLSEQLPTSVRREFYENLESFNKTAAVGVSTKLVNAGESSDTFNGVVQTVSTEVGTQSKRLGNIVAFQTGQME